MGRKLAASLVNCDFLNISVEKTNKWSVKGVNLQTDSSKHSITGSCLIQQWCKAWSSWNIRPKSQCVCVCVLGGKETRLLGTGPPPGCSELALVSTWLCPLSATQRGRWMGVNWNQFLLSQTINGVAQTGAEGGRPRAFGYWSCRTNMPGMYHLESALGQSMSHLRLCTHMDTSESASQAHQPTHGAEWLTGCCRWTSPWWSTVSCVDSNAEKMARTCPRARMCASPSVSESISR